LQQALNAGVANADIESKLGMYLSESGRVREGLPLLERAAARPPVEVDTLNALAIGYARAGMADRAIATFTRVLEIDSRRMAWQNIGSRSLAEGICLRAMRSTAVRPIPIAAAYTGLGVVERRRTTRRRDRELEEGGRARSPRVRCAYNLVTELAGAGRREEARSYAQRFVETAPEARYGEDIERVRGYLRQ
jgi:tetratricopeptide (TPR) repeat protein